MKKTQAIQAAKSTYVTIKYPITIIVVMGILLYIKSLRFGLTQLDDSIFINDFHVLFSNIKNLGHLFFRGVFFETTDSYYRPILMVSFMFNKLVTGDLFGYHVTNLIFHLSSCILLYYFLLKIHIRADISFILTLLFTVHPALSQAVVWIPGRNDSMLTTFALASFLFIVNYFETKKWYAIVLHFFFLFLALYTKESGIILPFIMLGYLILFGQHDFKKYIVCIAGWLCIAIVWFYMRSISIDPIIKPSATDYLTGFIDRLPLFIHYIGKSFLPFNLSVFPMQADTHMYWGLITVTLLTLLLVMNKNSNKKRILFGLSWFTLFLLPAFFVPKEINEQAFEHRLYLPIIGLLILFSEISLFSEKNIPNQKNVFWFSLIAVPIFSIINYGHQQKFKNEFTYWENAVADSPSSSYAHKILGVKYLNANELEESEIEIKKALAIDSTERYANLYYAKILLLKNPKNPKTEYYLLKEEQYHPGFIDNLFELAKLNFEKGDKVAAEYYLEACIKASPTFMMAKNNLILLLVENGQKEKAREKINQWKVAKSGVPKGIEILVNTTP